MKRQDIIKYPMIANFLAAFAASWWLGGDALNGYSANGHYFLGHGFHYTEVSHAVFLYSTWHTLSVIFMLPIGACFLAAFRDDDEFADEQREKMARTLKS